MTTASAATVPVAASRYSLLGSARFPPSDTLPRRFIFLKHGRTALAGRPLVLVTDSAIDKCPFLEKREFGFLPNTSELFPRPG